MNCPTCNAAVPGDAVFCPSCGARLAGRGGTTESEGAVARSAGASVSSPMPFSASPGKVAAESGMRTGARRDEPEQELWQGGYSPKAMYGSWAAAAIATVLGLVVVMAAGGDPTAWTVFAAAVAVVWGGLLLTLLYRRLSERYRLTTQRFFHERGILRRVTDRIEVIDIDDVTFEQGIIERMLGVGTLRINSSDRTTPELRLPGIDEVKEVANTIDQARRAERQRRAVYIESV